jgi:hypothetical protein
MTDMDSKISSTLNMLKAWVTSPSMQSDYILGLKDGGLEVVVAQC